MFFGFILSLFLFRNDFQPWLLWKDILFPLFFFTKKNFSSTIQFVLHIFFNLHQVEGHWHTICLPHQLSTISPPPSTFPFHPSRSTKRAQSPVKWKNLHQNNNNSTRTPKFFWKTGTVVENFGKAHCAGSRVRSWFWAQELCVKRVWRFFSYGSSFGASALSNVLSPSSVCHPLLRCVSRSGDKTNEKPPFSQIL